MTMTVKGELPPSLARVHDLDNVLFTYLTKMITIAHPEARPQVAGFESEIHQQLAKADALTTDNQREELRKLFHDFLPIFF